MGDLSQKFKGHLTRGVQILLNWQQGDVIITCLWRCYETSIITRAFRGAPQTQLSVYP